jgi:hypothetical protein
MATIILAILFSIILLVALAVLINSIRKGGLTVSESPSLGLDPVKISPTHAVVAGGLAGFTIAVVTLVVTLIGLDRIPPYELQLTIMIFLMGFLEYVSAASLYATVPGRSEILRGFTFVLATYMYITAQVLSLLAFQPLFSYLGYSLITLVLPFIVLSILLGGFFSAFSALHVLMGIRRRICNYILLSVSFWVLLHFVLSRLWTNLWPDTQLPWIIFIFVVQSLTWAAFSIPMSLGNLALVRKLQLVFSVSLAGLSLMALEYNLVAAFTI